MVLAAYEKTQVRPAVNGWAYNSPTVGPCACALSAYTLAHTDKTISDLFEMDDSEIFEFMAETFDCTKKDVVAFTRGFDDSVNRCDEWEGVQLQHYMNGQNIYKGVFKNV